MLVRRHSKSKSTLSKSARINDKLSAKIILLFADKGTLEVTRDGEPPTTPYSHDRNVFHMAHEALKQGARVLIGARRGAYTVQHYLEITEVYPTWTFATEPQKLYEEFTPDIVIGVHPQDVDVRSHFPKAVIIGVSPAVGFVEYPVYHRIENSTQFIGRQLISSLHNSIDYVVTQNPRMKEILALFYNVLGSWDHLDRILVAPFGYVAEEQQDAFDRDTTRREMGLKPGEIAIVSSGGIWKWTDFNTFLRAFAQVSPLAPNLKLFIMGFKQPDNQDHTRYIAETKKILSKHKDLVGKSIIVFDDWHAASKLVKNYTRAADIGINVNKESLENWQSHRVRFTEYMRYGITAINTDGDYISTHAAREAVFRVTPGDIESYVETLSAIAANPDLVKEKHEAMRKVARAYSSDKTTGTLMSFLINEATPLPRSDHSHAFDDGALAPRRGNSLRRAFSSFVHRTYSGMRQHPLLLPVAERVARVDWLRRFVQRLEGRL